MAASLLVLVTFCTGTVYAEVLSSRSVSVASGSLVGVRDGGITVYKGVPYAAPPVGSLRWRSPQPARSWKGVRRADRFAPACMQKGVSMPGEAPPAVSEDCLYLNIWTPAGAPRKGLPILVWIHGGGFTNGSASMPLYWGDRLARDGIIVVTVAYRLGPFGFLAYPALTRESPHHSSGNYGLMDQIAALKWVRRNIPAFGGDPRRVTVAGQSAGAMFVSMLMASPLAHGLFQRAIGESGGFFEPLGMAPAYRFANAERQGERYAAALGAGNLAELRALPAADLLRGDVAAVSHPIIEPYALPMSPYEAFATGQQNDVPILVGSNAAEARALMNPSTVTAKNFTRHIARSLGAPAAFIGTLDVAYPHRTNAEARQSAIEIETDLRFGWDMWTWARLQARARPSGVYYYYFTQRPPFPKGSPYYRWGASHFAELWYVFDHLDQERWNWTSNDRRLALDVSSFWVHFVKSGDPNGPGLPHWPVYKAGTASVLYLGSFPHPGPVAHLARLQAINSIYLPQLRRNR
jgi:para-nitrobenzyl esterase